MSLAISGDLLTFSTIDESTNNGSSDNRISDIAPKSEWMRRVFWRDVREDTLPAFASRFLVGAAGGAIVGGLLALRDLRGGEAQGEDS